MDNLMIDLETLGTNVGSIIVSLGAVWFDGKERLGTEFYKVFDLADQAKYGRTINPDTVKWWMNQTEVARKVFQVAPTKTSVVLADFVSFLGEGTKYAKVWGNGADFDCVLLGSLYETYGVQKPWSYSNNRCFRTLKHLGNGLNVPEPAREGTHHNALDDARHQAMWANKILGRINGSA